MTKRASSLFPILSSSVLILFLIGTPWFFHVHADACNGEPTSSTPSAKAPHFAPGTAASPHTINIYVGQAANITPFSGAEKLEIAAAVQSWFQSGPLADNHIIANFVTTDPGAGTADSIRIMSDPSSSLSSVGFTADHQTDSAGVITGGSTISINKTFTFPDATGSPKIGYDPTLSSASSYFTGVVAHEIGHVLGLADTGEIPCHAQSTSVMGPTCGTNNGGDYTSPADPTSNAPTSCDKSTVTQNIVNPSANGNTTNSNTGGDPIGGGDPGTGGTYSGGGSSDYYCYSWSDWNEETFTLTDYSDCYSY